jgi:hypothetical protein
MHDTVGIVVRTSAHSTRVTHSLADAILRVAPVRLGVIVACHCSLRGNDRLQLGYKRVIPALYPRYTRVIPALYHRYTIVIPALYPRYTIVIPALYPRYSRVIPALYPRHSRVIPAFVGALICCSRTAAPLLSFALPSVIYARVNDAGVTTVSSACLCPQLPREHCNGK